ncbi:HDOD domain-containing protein [Candidatus Poribacteria bacterium]|nr:HDOD domain-containing protein [Candidatus Poribacteria bacterium]
MRKTSVQVRKPVRSTKDLKILIQESVLSLPTLPHVFMAILEQVSKEKTSATDVAQIIGRDQSLTSRVLAIANSPAYGFKDRISTVPRAVTLLGFDAVRDLVQSVSIFDDFLNAKRIASFDKTRFWEHSLVCAAVAKEIARQVKLSSTNEAYVAGLLHDVGKVALDSAAGGLYSDILGEVSSEDVRSVMVERQYLGTDHAEIGGILSEKWSLPADIVTAIRYHHEMPEDALKGRQEIMTAVVAVADFVCWVHGFSSVDAFQPPYLGERAQKLISIDRLDIDKICEAVDRQIMSTAELFNLQVPDANKFRDALKKANVELGRINCLYEEAKRQLQRQVDELSRLNRALYHIRQNLNVDLTIRALLGAIRDELSYSRVLFFRFRDGNESLCLADYLTEPKLDRDYSKIDFGFKSNNLLSDSLAEKKIMKFTRKPETSGDPIFANLDTDEVFMIPVPSKGGLLGVVLADNNYSQKTFSPISVESLGILAHEAGLAIDNALLFEKTTELATKDELTGLYNRRYCSECLRTEIERSRRYKRPLSIAMFDIDHFKNFNDAYGHNAGDKILKLVARFMHSCSRGTDVVGRHGGEEFLAILPETDAGSASVYCERVRLAVEKLGKTECADFVGSSLSISGGVTAYIPDADTPETIVERADQALYKAKQNGRNRIASV